MRTDMNTLILSRIRTASGPQNLAHVAFPAATRHGKNVMQSVRVTAAADQHGRGSQVQGAASHRTLNFASEALKSKLQAGNPEEGEIAP